MASRRSSSRNPVLVIALMLAAGAAVYRFVGDRREGPPRVKSKVAAESDAEPQVTNLKKLPSSMSVYFSNTYGNDPEIAKRDPNNIDRHLAEFIAEAHTSLDCAFYELESQRIADALIAAQLRGVRVRIVGDSDYRDNEEMQGVIAAGIPVVFDGRSALMHDKFVVRDGRAVWSGSYNATDNCSFRNNNNALIIPSADLAANYATEFAEMFERNEFGPKSTSNTPHSLVKLGDIDIYNYFAPEDDIPPKVVRFIKAARRSIHFMAFSFSDDAIGDALIERKRSGIPVEGVVETRGSDGKGGEMTRLVAAGIPVMKDANKYMMHHKVIIIDGLWTITGSYNFTASAANSNDENILIIKSTTVAEKFEQEYKRIKSMTATKVNV